MTTAYLEKGRIINEHLWLDAVDLHRELGLFPSPVSIYGTQSLTPNPLTLPLAINPDEDSSEKTKRHIDNLSWL